MTEPATDPGRQPSGPLARLKALFARHEFLRHFTVLVSGTAIAQVIQIAAMIAVARLFSPLEMGIFTIVNAAASLLVPVAALRYDMAIVLPESNNDARRLVRISTVINTIISAVFTLAMFIAADPLARWLINRPPAGTTMDQMVDQVRPWLYTAGILMWLLAEVAIATFWLTRTKDFTTISQNRVTRAFSASVMQVAAGGLNKVAHTGAGGLVLATIVGQLMQLTNLVRRAGKFWRYDDDSPLTPTKELLAEYKKMPLLNAPNALVDSVRLQGIPLLIARFGAEATGQFGMAWKLLQAPMGLINGAIQQIFFQKLSVTKRGRMFALIKSTTIRSLLIGIVPFALIYLLGPILLPWVLGSQWRLAGEISAALVPWLYLNFVTSPISTVFVMARRQGLMLIFALFYAGVPLGILWWGVGEPLLEVLNLMSWSMFGLLVIFILLAFHVSRVYDRSPEDAEEDELLAAETSEVEVENEADLVEPGDPRHHPAREPDRD